MVPGMTWALDLHSACKRQVGTWVPDRRDFIKDCGVVYRRVVLILRRGEVTMM